jgi:type I restriction enzyme M protein
MSPKGGIVPHNRVSVQSKRSEVLFVDYMAEHLTPNGRAAIIVPEGIIFQGQTAHTQLRKMLVENYLVAVVSLPAGVFNPYAGVKTSILILDKLLARRTNTIAFFKIENDGFGLGAQRREIDKNDLPQVHAEISEYLRRLRAGESVVDFQPGLGLVVEEEKVAANGDFNLNGERYRAGITRASHYPVVPLGEVANVISGQSPPGESYNETGDGIPFYQGKTEFGEMFIGAPTKWTTDPQRFADAGGIIISVRAPVGPVNLTTQRVCIGRGLASIEPMRDRLIASYAFYFLKSQEEHIKGDAGAVFASINRGDIEKLEIPLPPLEVQKEIVAEIEGYQKVVNGARAVLDNYRPRISAQPDWPVGRLADVCTLISGQHVDKASYNTEGRGICYLTGPADFGPISPLVSKWTEHPKVVARRGDILVTVKGSGLGKVNLLDISEAAISRQLMAVRVSGAVPAFIFILLSGEFGHFQALGDGAAIPGITRDDVLDLPTALPPLAMQQAIVAEIEAEQALVAANRELIERFENKIQATLARVWGEDEPVRAEG